MDRRAYDAHSYTADFNRIRKDPDCHNTNYLCRKDLVKSLLEGHHHPNSVTASRQQTRRRQTHQQEHVDRHCLPKGQGHAKRPPAHTPACTQEDALTILELGSLSLDTCFG